MFSAFNVTQTSKYRWVPVSMTLLGTSFVLVLVLRFLGIMYRKIWGKRPPPFLRKVPALMQVYQCKRPPAANLACSLFKFFMCTIRCRNTEIREEGFSSDGSEDEVEDEDVAADFDGFNGENLWSDGQVRGRREKGGGTAKLASTLV